MTWTSPKTMTSEIGTSSDWNTYVRDNELYLYGIAQGVAFQGVAVGRSAATSIADSSFQTITWTSEALDYGGWWGSGTDVIVPAGAIPSGYTTIACLVLGRTKFAANGTGNRAIRVSVNGTGVIAPTVPGLSGDVTEVLVVDVITLVAADVVTVQLYQTSGGGLNASDTTIKIIRLAPVV